MSTSDDVDAMTANGEGRTSPGNPYAGGVNSGGGSGGSGKALPGLAAFGNMQAYAAAAQAASQETPEDAGEGRDAAAAAPHREQPRPQAPEPEEAAYPERRGNEAAGEAERVHPHEPGVSPGGQYAGAQPYAAAEQPDPYAAEPYATPEPYAARGGEPEADWRTGDPDHDYSPEELQQYIAAQEFARDRHVDAGGGARQEAAFDPGYAHDGPPPAAAPGGQAEEPYELSSQMAVQAFEARYDQDPEIPLASFEEPGEQPFFHEDGRRDAEFVVPEEESREALTGERKSRRVLMLASGLVGALALGGALAFAYKTGGNPQLAGGGGGDGGPPLIKADDSPVKVAPEEPGGKEFPHQNKQIYDRLENDRNSEGERIVSREEEVASLPETPGGSGDGEPAQPRATRSGRPEQNERGDASAQSGGAETENGGGPHKVRTLQVRPDGSVVSSQNPDSANAGQPRNESAQRSGTGGQLSSTENTGSDASAGAGRQTAAAGRQQPRVPDLPTSGGGTPAGVAVTMPSTSGGEASGQERAGADPSTVASVEPAREQSGQATGGQSARSGESSSRQPQEASASAAPLPQPKPSAPPQSARRETASASASAGTGGGRYAVQVASRRSQAMALAAFADLQQKYTDLLGNYEPMIESADLGDKGVWYRLRVGPMNRESQAQSLCDNLKKAGLRSCLVRQQ